MRVLAYILWLAAGVWIVLAIVGSAQFQEVYGGTSGIQFFALAAGITFVPILLGWWAYRRGAASRRC